MIVFAHRGFSSSYPENTLLAFTKAIEVGATGLEFDVHLTRDNQLVVFHDATLTRITGVEGLVNDYTLAQLQKMDAGSYFDSSFCNEKIPSLDEVLEIAKEKDIFVNIELKSGIYPYPGLEQQVVKKIKYFGLAAKTTISSFNHPSLLEVKKIDENLSTGILYYARLYEPWKYAHSIGANALHPYYQGIDGYLLQGAKERDLKVNTYTVNNEKDMKKLIHIGVDAIITDYPNLLAALLQKGPFH